MEIPTSLLKNNFFASQGLHCLSIFDDVLLKSVIHKMVHYNAFCEFGNAKGVEPPIDRMPSLERVICRNKDGVFFSWNKIMR